MDEKRRNDRSTTEIVPASLAAELRAELSRRRRDIERLRAVVAGQDEALAAVQGSAGWNAIRRWRHARDRLAASAPSLGRAIRMGAAALRAWRRGGALAGAPTAADAYERFVEAHALAPEATAEMRADLARTVRRPVFTLVAVLGDAPAAIARRGIASVRQQIWPWWQLVVIHGPSASPDAVRLVEEAASEDGRVRRDAGPADLHAAAAAHRALGLASGEIVVFLDLADELAPETLYELALCLEAEPLADVVYGDEDRIDVEGRRSEPTFKPDWSPELLLSTNYLGRATAIRRSLVADVGGPRAEHGAAWHYDLVLRATERARRVAHVAKVLVHVRRRDGATCGGEVVEGGLADERRAVGDALRRRGLDARVEPTSWSVHRVRYAIAGAPLVSIVMPTKDRVDLLRTCVESVDARSTWSRRELLVVDNGSTEAAARRYLRALERRHRVLRDPRPFNWSALNNAAARAAQGDVLLFMNNDMEVIAPDWIEALLEHAQREDVGAVGAKLLYPDGTIQHAGIALGLGVAGHPFKRLPDAEGGHAQLPHAVREVSAVTGACLMVRRDVFERLGGFDEQLAVAFNDVDFCLRLRAAGLRIVYTPHAALVHYESVTRAALHPQREEELMRARWRWALLDDPYYSPNLTRSREDGGIGP